MRLMNAKSELTEKELYMSLVNMQNSKLVGNNRLTIEFFVIFWDEMKYVFLNSCRTVERKKE